VVFLAHYTGSGVNEILSYDVDFFFQCLDSAISQYEEFLKLQNGPKEVIILGFAEK